MITIRLMYRVNVNCNKYIFREQNDCDEYIEDSREEKECDYCMFKKYLEEALNNKLEDVWLDDIVSFYRTKYRLFGKDVVNNSYYSFLIDALDLLEKWLKERKVIVEDFEIKEQEEDGKKKWDYHKIGYIDPCAIRNKNKLANIISDRKAKVKKSYIYLLDKY